MCFAIISFEDVTDETKENISNFLEWFTVQGFYAEAFTFIKGSFDRTDSEHLQNICYYVINFKN
ncbi:hypothetical protein [Cyanobacterium sp. Dongsha4]|uniref:hypothetical protein n=1 Tax=Cyanobacterium sp. DS4 TaxID=2878255 RepID=UPI002E80647A|nr:hypothetical protein [Cyanobacterium sp. Dongsha4]WVK99738.1 hypothetical protein Dongsha4_13795 [Cyanobacterium sp. Dongsha4]